MLHRAVFATLLLATPQVATAQDQGNGIEFRFGLGPSSEPGYFGDNDTDLGVDAEFELERLQLGGVSVGGNESYGLGFAGSIRIVSARNADDFDELSGLDDIDTSLEVGGGVEFTTPNYEMFAKLRYGVIGHESFVAEIGTDVFYRPTDQLTFEAGPRILFGDDDYAQTYFGISAAEAGESGLAAYDADGGLIGAGAQAKATYAINDDWEVVGTLKYEQLRNDAADSPITQLDEQVSGSIVLTRRITLGF